MVKKDKIGQYKKWTQRYLDAHQEVSRLTASTDRFFEMGEADVTRWEQSVKKLSEALEN